jgi:hypothetical protein
MWEGMELNDYKGINDWRELFGQGEVSFIYKTNGLPMAPFHVRIVK